jgi:dipeptidyl aminopeptidase/acylaminoacyl peptidase
MREIHTVNMMLMVTLFLGGTVAGNGQTAPVSQVSIEDFFRNPEAVDYRLSPDGRYYAYVGSYHGINNIFLREVGKPDAIRLTDATDRDINRFFWGNNRYIMYLQDNEGDENFNLYRVNIGQKNVDCMTPFEGVKVTIIDVLRNMPDDIIVGMNKRDPELFDPYRLNIVTGEMVRLAENLGNVKRWMSDNDGVIRVAFTDGIMYREGKRAEFREILSVDFDDTFIPHCFTSDNQYVYAYSNLGRDKIAIVEYDLDEGKEIRVLFENPVYDVFGDDERDYFTYSYGTQKLQYALFTAERRTLHFFDEEIKRLYSRLRKEIGDYEIVFESASDDFGRVIVNASSDRMPGAYYLYDRDSDKLELMHKVAPWLDENEMAAMQTVHYTARDGLTIHGYLTLPKGVKAENLPVIVHVHAGPQWRNSWGFDAKTQFFANRGYAVFQVNFRGSTGYGKEFLRAGFRQWGLAMQDDITDGVRWLIDNGIADRDRIAIFGWSYGGYAALAGVTFTPDLYACGVDLWGISNYFTLYAGFPPYWKSYLEQINERWGDPVEDSLQMYQTSPVFHVENIKVPVFIAQGANDSRVRMRQSEQMVEELKKYKKEFEYELIQGEGHAFSNEKKTIDLMTKIENFLARHIGCEATED